MRRFDLLYTLPTRSTTVGNWHFRQNLLDESPEQNHFIGPAPTVADCYPGLTEQGLTTFVMQNANAAAVPAASATDFDFGTDGFTIELIAALPIIILDNLLLSKFASLTGFQVLVNAAGHVTITLGNGTTSVTCAGTDTLNDSTYYYLVITVDRALNQVRFYVNGQPDAGNPISTATVAGSISAPSAPLQLCGDVASAAFLDQLCISREVLTAAAIADRAAAVRQAVDNYAGAENFLLRYFPSANHENAALRAFMAPFTAHYRDMMVEVESIQELIDPQACPARFLPHQAAGLGFELIDAPYATEQERRRFIDWAIWIYRRKGTLAAVTKIIELLGFTPTITETFPTQVPFISNRHRAWDRSQYFPISVNLPCDSRLGLDAPLTYGSTWEIVSGRLRGTGNGVDSPLNGVTFGDSLSKYRISADYELVSGLTSNDRFGLYLKWVDSNNWISLVVTIGTSQYLMMAKSESGTVTSTTLYDLSANLAIDQFLTGQHRLWILADHTTNRYTGGIDSRTLFYNVSITMAAPAATRKGLLVNKYLSVDWDDVRVDDADFGDTPVTWTESLLVRDLGIILAGSPAFAANKKNYLAQMLQEYVPAGVTLSIS